MVESKPECPYFSTDCPLQRRIDSKYRWCFGRFKSCDVYKNLKATAPERARFRRRMRDGEER